jgi:hypothetical protein
MLREKFGRGLEVGGTVGGCVCRAVLSVADEHGVEIDAVVDGFRRPRHRELIERANHAEYLQQYLGKRLAEPSFEKPPSEKARISGIGARALADDPGTKPERKGPLPRKTQSHFTKTFSRFPTPQPDEVSARRKRRTNKRK